MSKSNLQTNLEYVAAYSLLAIFGWLPMRLALFAGSTMGSWAYYFSGRLRRTGQRNLELAFPELTQPERRVLLRGCFEHLGRLLRVFSQFATTDRQTLQSLFECEGLEPVSAALDSGRGVIFFPAD